MHMKMPMSDLTTSAECMHGGHLAFIFFSLSNIAYPHPALVHSACNDGNVTALADSVCNDGDVTCIVHRFTKRYHIDNFYLFDHELLVSGEKFSCNCCGYLGKNNFGVLFARAYASPPFDTNLGPFQKGAPQDHYKRYFLS